MERSPSLPIGTALEEVRGRELVAGGGVGGRWSNTVSSVVKH